MLLGFPDPFPGWLREEIEAALAQAQARLIERRLLQREVDGRLTMDMLAAALIGTMIEPQRSLLLARTNADGVTVQCAACHRPPLFVWLEGNLQQGWTVQAIEPDMIPEQIESCWNLTTQSAPSTKSLVLPIGVIEAARAAWPNGKAGLTRTLERYGVAAAEAQILAHTLSTARQNSVLTLLSRQGQTWLVRGLGILEGENGLWLLRQEGTNDRPLVVCQPCSAGLLRSELRAQLQRAGWLEA